MAEGERKADGGRPSGSAVASEAGQAAGRIQRLIQHPASSAAALASLATLASVAPVVSLASVASLALACIATHDGIDSLKDAL